MEIRPFNPQSDYETVKEWWAGQKWTAMPLDYLPKVGMMVPEVCAGWLYQSDSKIAWVEFIIANPNTTKEERSEGLNLLIKGLLDKAKDLGFGAVFTSAQHPGLIKRYTEFGFQVTDTGMSTLIRRL